jgi:hypothetical protein
MKFPNVQDTTKVVQNIKNKKDIRKSQGKRPRMNDILKWDDPGVGITKDFKEVIQIMLYEVNLNT